MTKPYPRRPLWATLNFAVCLVLGVSFAAVARTPLPDYLTALATELESSGIRVGVVVEDLSANRLFAYRADSPFHLASNTKLFTTAAALATLSPDFRWETTARLDGSHLWVVGGGDPSFHTIGGVNYPEKFLDATAKALKERKKTTFTGLIVDARCFDSVFQHPGWPPDQLKKSYAAPISGIPLDRGLVTLPNGKRAVTSWPLGVARQYFAEGLKKRGIEIGIVRMAAEKEAAPLESAVIYRQKSYWNLAQAVQHINTYSDNYMAEHLFKTLGWVVNGNGSFEGGAAAVRDALLRLGVPLNGYRQADGSGLARNGNIGNMATPETVTALLLLMAKHPQGGAYVKSLAVGGEMGTLAGRFQQTALVGHVFAKTGFIQGVLTLSGYMVTDNGQVAAFSILANYPLPDTFETRERIRQFQFATLAAVWEDLMQRQSTPSLAATPVSSPPAGKN